MNKYTIKDVSLNDFVLRTNEDEKQIFITASSSQDGWGNLIAWNPVEVFAPKSDNSSEIANELNEFTKRQEKLGRLVGGYESYDFGCYLHNVKTKKKSEELIPDVVAYAFESWIRFENGLATVFCKDDDFKNYVDDILSRPPKEPGTNLYSSQLLPKQSRDWYHESYVKIKNYIKSGDVYQVNLTHPLKSKFELGGRELFNSLNLKSKVDFQSYMEVDGFEIISFSPERFIQVKDKHIKTSPIKGTRERGNNLTHDEALRLDLENNPKDLAELNMITDLLRNDLGKICKVGSVDVIEKRVITKYPTLWHAHSTIIGTLEDAVSPIAALSSMMPGGSVTGCPKKRAIEIIDELEPNNRGLYTGSIFVIDENGNLDSSIVIRTMIKNGYEISLSVGGGIVNNSNENDEYEESLDKAKSFLQNDSSVISSDILESQFGPTEIDILYQDKDTRVIATKVLDSKKILELSYVEFIKDGIKAFPDIHNEIISGKSIGKAFKDSNIEIYRTTHRAYKTVLSDEIQNTYRSTQPSSVVDVTVNVGPGKIPYARILETYSSDVIWANECSVPTDEEMEKIKKLSELIR